MSENENALREYIRQVAPHSCAMDGGGFALLDALLAEHRAEVERLAEEKAEAERYRDSWRRRWSEDVGSARDAALEEARDTFPDDGMFSGRTVRGILKELKSNPAERYLRESEVRRILEEAKTSAAASHWAAMTVAIAARLGVDLDADGGPLKRCDLHDDCSRPEEGRKP